MKFKCLSTGSQGNCYLLESEDECLVLDCGIPLLQVKIATGFNIRKIVGAVVTHEHKDHAGYVQQFVSAGIKTILPYSATNTATAFTHLGNFKIAWFPLVHDVPCFGYLIEHPGCGRFIYVTDTEYCKYRFKDLTWMAVEANYDKSLMDDSLDGTVKRNHVLTGHMDIDTTCRFIAANQNPRFKGVILVHKSDSQGDAELFKGKAKNVTDALVEVADRGLEVEL